MSAREPSLSADAATPKSAATLQELEAEARALWGERQEGCAQLGADLPMPTIAVPVNRLAELIRVHREMRAALQDTWLPLTEYARELRASGDDALAEQVMGWFEAARSADAEAKRVSA